MAAEAMTSTTQETEEVSGLGGKDEGESEGQEYESRTVAVVRCNSAKTGMGSWGCGEVSEFFMLSCDGDFSTAIACFLPPLQSVLQWSIFDRPSKLENSCISTHR